MSKKDDLDVLMNEIAEEHEGEILYRIHSSLSVLKQSLSNQREANNIIDDMQKLLIGRIRLLEKEEVKNEHD